MRPVKNEDIWSNYLGTGEANSSVDISSVSSNASRDFDESYAIPVLPSGCSHPNKYTALSVFWKCKTLVVFQHSRRLCRILKVGATKQNYESGSKHEKM